MAKVLAVTKAITTLTEVETRFGLSQIDDSAFFPEWQASLPVLSTGERDRLRIIRQRLQYHRADGELLEGSVMLLVVSPLLELAGFYDAPFKLKAEATVEISVDDGEETLRGRIDALILRQQGVGDLWVLVVESKKTTISTRSALPQALAYMMANPNLTSSILAQNQPGQPTIGMMTNGDDVLFVKLMLQPERQYGLSRVFSLYTVPQELETVLQVLKQIGEIAVGEENQAYKIKSDFSAPTHPQRIEP